jgi:hypothetical protein
MKNPMQTRLILLTLIASAAARADFSYTQTSKSGGGPGGAGGESVTKHYIKGQRMMTDTGSVTIIMDFDAQTMTMVNKTQKTYTVTKFADMGQTAAASGADVKVDVKETGQHKTINGFNASEVVMTMQIDSPQMQGRGAGMKLQMEMDLWISPDVPGAGDLLGFYKRNADRFPWTAMAQGANPGMRAAMADLQRKIAGLKGIPVLEVIRVKNAGAGGDQAAAAQSDPRMAAARAQLEAMAKQGGPAAAQAQAALARMGGGAGSGSGAMFETTMESANFSTNPIPDSVFAIPAGFERTQK